MNDLTTILFALTLSVLLTACDSNSAPPLTASNVDIRAALPGMRMQSGYMTLNNHSDADIRITAIKSSNFTAIEMHETIVDNGIAKMRSIAPLIIAAHSSVSFAPGGKHLMLMGPKNTMDRNLTLDFYDEEYLLLTIDVVSGESE